MDQLVDCVEEIIEKWKIGVKKSQNNGNPCDR